MSAGPRPSDRFIPWYIVLFFVVLTAFFAWFYHIASSTHTGLVMDAAYEKGLKYNDTIAKSEAQSRLGWTSSIEKKGDGVQFFLRDKDGQALSGARVRLWLVRPVHAGIDQHLEMKEVSSGHYLSSVTVPEKGLWEARIGAQKDGRSYQTSKRIEF